MYILRDYQQEAVDYAVAFFTDKTIKWNVMEVLPTGSGKSLIIAGIVKEIDEPVLVFQPTKEILEQNVDKARSYGIEISIYSASANSKEISRLTYATIGSAINNIHLFEQFKHIIIDECHFVNPKQGMYKRFLDALGKIKVLGLTATPYRLSTDGWGGSILKFLTRTRPRVFKELIYYVQIADLLNKKHLANLQYFNIPGFERQYLSLNSTGADYTDESVKKYYEMINFKKKMLDVINLLLVDGRKRVLVFTKFITESEFLKANIPECELVTSKTKKKDREEILKKFKSGEIKVIANVGVLTTGFDYPELDNIVLGRPTMSLGLYYQMIGRGMRPHIEKLYTAVVDLCGNYDRFGKVEELRIVDGKNGKWYIANNDEQLTNVYYE